MVFSGFVTACRFAGCPTSTSPVPVKATTEGVVRAPSEFSMTLPVPPSMMATQEFVVPRSIPITLAILTLRCVISALQQRLLGAAANAKRRTGSVDDCTRSPRDTLTAIKVHGFVPDVAARTEMSGRPRSRAHGKVDAVNATPHRARYQPHHSARLPLGGFMRSDSDIERDVENEEDALSKLPKFHYA